MNYIAARNRIVRSTPHATRNLIWGLLLAIMLIALLNPTTAAHAQEQTNPSLSSEASIWDRCNINVQPESVVFLDTFGTEVAVHSSQLVNTVLDLRGEPLAWSPESGFALTEAQQEYAWIRMVLPDQSYRYAMITRGVDHRNQWLAFVTDDLTPSVASYGGNNSWHVRCGGWQLDGDIADLLDTVLSSS